MRYCPECGIKHMGRKSLCGFCEERLFAPLTEPVSGMPVNTPQANRFRVGAMAASVRRGKGQ